MLESRVRKSSLSDKGTGSGKKLQTAEGRRGHASHLHCPSTGQSSFTLWATPADPLEARCSNPCGAIFTQVWEFQNKALTQSSYWLEPKLRAGIPRTRDRSAPRRFWRCWN